MVSVSMSLVLQAVAFIIVWFVAYLVLQSFTKTLVEGLLGLVPVVAGIGVAYYVYTWLVTNAII